MFCGRASSHLSLYQPLLHTNACYHLNTTLVIHPVFHDTPPPDRNPGSRASTASRPARQQTVFPHAIPDMSVLHNNEFQDPRFRLSFYGIHICQNPPVRTDIASLHCLFHTSAKLSKTRHHQGRRHPDIQTFCPHRALLRTKFRYTSNGTDR